MTTHIWNRPPWGSQSGTPILTAAETSGRQRFYPSGGRRGRQTSSLGQKPGQLTAAPGCFYIYCDRRVLSDSFFFPPAGPPAFLPACLLKHSFEMASLTVLLATRPLTCPNAASKKLKGSSRPKIRGWKTGGLVQTEHAWLNPTDREGPSGKKMTGSIDKFSHFHIR